MTIDVEQMRLSAKAACEAHRLVTIDVGAQYRASRVTEFSTIAVGSNDPHPFGFPPNMTTASNDSDVLAQIHVSPTEQLRLLFGGRINVFAASARNLKSISDAEAKTPNNVNPMGRVAVVWNPLAVATVKAMYGRAVKNPMFYQLYVDLPPAITPEPGARPEVQDTFEVALDLGLPTGVTIRSAVFHNTHRDQIIVHHQSKLRNETGSNLDAVVQTYGAEGSVLWSSNRLRMDLSVTAQGYNGKSDRLFPAPRLLGQAFVTWRVPSTEGLRLTSRFHGRSGIGDLDPAFDFDAGLLWQPSASVTFTFTGRNLLGRHQQVHYSHSNYVAEVRRARILRFGLVLSI